MKKEGVKILISGWYGHGNIGDEAILQSMIDKFKEEFNAEVWALSDNPQYTMNFQKIKAFHQLPISCFDTIKGMLTLKFYRSLKKIKECDIFIMGGGGFLSDWQKEVPFGWLKQMVIAKIFRKNTMLYGIGAGPFNTTKGKFIVKAIINNFVDKITVRDDASKDWLVKCGVKEEKIVITADQAISMKNFYRKDLINFNFNNTKNNIGIIVMPYLKNKNIQKYISLKKSLIDFLKKAGENPQNNIILIPFQNNPDYEFCSEILSEANINAEIIKCPGEHLLINNLLSSLDVVISLRLHGNILAASQKIPFIPIVYHHKTYEFCQNFGWEHILEFGEGTNWRNVDLDTDKLLEKVEYFIKNKTLLKKELEIKLNNYLLKEEKNIEVLMELLNSKQLENKSYS